MPRKNRNAEVLELRAAGYDRAAIACKLGMSVRRVRNILESIGDLEQKPPPGYYTITQIAEATGRTEVAVGVAMRAGKLRYARIGRLMCSRGDWVNRWLKWCHE